MADREPVDSQVTGGVSIWTSGRYDPRVAIERLIFLKMSLPCYGVGRCLASCCSLLMHIHS